MAVSKWSNLDCFWWILFTATLANSRQRLRWRLCWSYRLLADPSVVPGHSLHWLSRFCRTGGLRNCPENKEEICLGQHQEAATNLKNITNKQESRRLDLWNQRPRRPSDPTPGSLSSTHLQCFAFNLHNLFKTAAQTRAQSLLLSGVSQLFPSQMSLMKLWPWPPATFFRGRLSQKPPAFTNSAVHGVPGLGRTLYLVAQLRTILLINLPFLYSRVHLFIFC